MPKLLDSVKTVVTIALLRCKPRMMTGASNDPHRQALLHADGEREILVGQCLVGNLLARDGILATMARIDDQITEVFVVLITT